MTIAPPAPTVELHFNPTELRPADLPKPGTYLGSPADAIEAALSVIRARMVRQLKAEMRGIAEPTSAQLLRIADLAWQALFPAYRKISAPVMADAYVRAYRKAGAGDVPTSVIYDLADKHAEKIGEYFHSTSRDALAEGFNTMVNRRVPAKAAADKVLDAYGLTPRQMRSYAAAQQFDKPVSDMVVRPLKAKARAYIDKAFMGRVRKLSTQEEHNIDQQAQQFAWMWLQDKGRLSEQAQKMWLTAHDEKVCPVCGPLHGQKVGINERFKTSQGEFWTPGLHPNCRCKVRLIENTFSKADVWDSRLHPRGGDPENPGRFSVRTRTKERPDVSEEVRRILEAASKPAPPETKPLSAVSRSTSQLSAMSSAPRVASAGPLSSVQRALSATEQSAPTPMTSVQTPVPLTAMQPLTQPLTAVGPMTRTPPAAPLAPKAGIAPLHDDLRSYYAVIKNRSLPPDDYDYQLTNLKFHDNYERAMAEAAQLRNYLMEVKFDELTSVSEGNRPSVITEDGDGNGIYSDIDADQLRDTIRHMATLTSAKESHPYLHGTNVPIYDDEGHDTGDVAWISYKDIADQLGISSYDLGVHVLTTKYGHTDSTRTIGGQGAQFEVSGNYVVDDHGTVLDKDGNPVEIRYLRPYIPRRLRPRVE